MSKEKYDVYEMRDDRFGTILNTFATEHYARQLADNQHHASGKHCAVVCGVVTIMRTDDPETS